MVFLLAYLTNLILRNYILFQLDKRISGKIRW